MAQPGKLGQDEPRRIVAIFGAGASAASGGLLLSQVLPKAFSLAEEAVTRGEKPPSWFRIVGEFLRSVFCVEINADGSCGARLPDLALVLSLVDLAIQRRRGFPGSVGKPEGAREFWPHQDLVAVREHLDGMILQAVRSGYVSQFEHWNGRNLSPRALIKAFAHEMFLDYLFRRDPDFSLISLNYDMFLERAACQHLELLHCGQFRPKDYFPRYHVDFEHPYNEEHPSRPVHKLHGSLDWAACPGCGRAYLMFTKQYWQRSARTQAPEETKKISRLDVDRFYERLLHPKNADTCGECSTPLRPMIVAPTLVKEYEDKHLEHVWRHAEKALRTARELYFIGYSLPPDDIGFAGLVKRSTQQIHPRNIHVILPDEAAIGRYQAVFGPEIRVHRMRFGRWLVRHRDAIATFAEYQDYGQARRKALRAAKARAAENPGAPTRRKKPSRSAPAPL